MSTQADIITIAQFIGTDLGEPTQLAHFYDEAVLALTDTELLAEFSMVVVTAGTGSYAIPTEAVRVLAAFFGSRELTRTTLPELERVSRTWRTDTGTPVMYVEQHEQERTVLLYPAPDTNSGNQSFPNGTPYGQDYPTNTLVLLTVSRTNTPPWMDFPLALAILAREFDKESAYRDPAFAMRAAKLSAGMRKLGSL